MATPACTRHIVSGSLGTIAIDLRTTAQQTPIPAVLLLSPIPGFADRLARAGFTSVERRPDEGTLSVPADILGVIAALEAGELGVPPPTSVGVVGPASPAGMEELLARRGIRFVALPEPPVDEGLQDAAVASLARQLP